jgi:hypothetical protein
VIKGKNLAMIIPARDEANVLRRTVDSPAGTFSCFRVEEAVVMC